MQTFFQDNSSEELILLFNGWGMDEKPFMPLASSRDILFVSDYSNFDFSPNIDFSDYKKIFSVTFSAGTFMAAFLKDKLPQFDLKIAVNGSLNMLDEKLGIPADVMKEMENINFANALDFRKKLFADKKHYNLFNKYQPSRSFESSFVEFLALRKYFTNPQAFEYDKIIIGQDDKIIPVENQLRAWQGHKNIKMVSGGHFPFYNFETFDDIINF